MSFPEFLPKELATIPAPTENEWASWTAKAIQGPGRPVPSAGRFAAWLVLALQGQGIAASTGGVPWTRDEVWDAAVTIMAGKGNMSDEEVYQILNGLITTIQNRGINGGHEAAGGESLGLPNPGMPGSAEEIEFIPQTEEQITVGRASISPQAIMQIIQFLIEIADKVIKLGNEIGPNRDKVLRYVWYGLNLAQPVTVPQPGNGNGTGYGPKPPYGSPQFPIPAPTPNPQPVSGCAPMAAALIMGPVIALPGVIFGATILAGMVF